jgi:hypothetical protein
MANQACHHLQSIGMPAGARRFAGEHSCGDQAATSRSNRARRPLRRQFM